MNRSEAHIEKIGEVVLNFNYYDGTDHYSEGVHEDILLDYVKKYDESEYERIILGSRLWSVMYHLSKRRENIVSFLPVDRSMSVLEIGSGCGAVTGALSELAGRVTCIELSGKRSRINAERHKNRDNIEIIVGNFRDIEPELDERYDVITLIGVLEYAESYIGGQDPYIGLIKRASEHLAENGILVIAIENKYGLKYFAGCKEDHTGRFFEGLEGYPSSEGVRTFSRDGLRKLIEAASMDCRFYYPYPDYKLPFEIFSDERLPEPYELNRNLNNYDADRIVVFDEEKVFDELIKDGLFTEFSNSFLVVAKKKGDAPGKDLPVYAKFSDERNQAYRTVTIISEAEESGKTVYKLALGEAAGPHIKGLSRKYERLSELYDKCILKPNLCEHRDNGAWLEYIPGITMEEYLDGLEGGGKYEEMLSLIDRFAETVFSLADEEFRPSKEFSEIFSDIYDGRGKCAPVSDIDLIFSNILFDHSRGTEGDWNVLDYEWTFEFPIPAGFIIYRSLFYYLRERENRAFSLFLKEKGIDIYERYGVSEDERSRVFPAMEHSFQLYLKRDTVSYELLHEIMPVSTVSLEDCVKERFSVGNLRNPQVYFSMGSVEGFLPENFINVLGDLSASDMSVNLDIELSEDARALRIDPIEKACMVRVPEACVSTGDGTVYSLCLIPFCDQEAEDERADTGKAPVFTSNGVILSERAAFFGHDDPQLIFLNLPRGEKRVRLRYIVERPSAEILTDLNEYLGSRDKMLEALTEEKEKKERAGGLPEKLWKRFMR